MCDICGSYPCFRGCPNEDMPVAHYFCEICKEGIYSGDEYLKNDNDEYVHLDCLNDRYEMAEFLGSPISTMYDD